MMSLHRQNPRWGSSNRPFTRWLPAAYQDQITQPIGWDPNLPVNNQILPLVKSCWGGADPRTQLTDVQSERSSAVLQVREVSNRILRTKNSEVESDPLYTHLVTIFGQWTDHDLTFTPHSPVIRSFSNGIDCEESCERTEPCFPIEVSVGATLRRAWKLKLLMKNSSALPADSQERPSLWPALRGVHAFLPLGAHLWFGQLGLYVRGTQRPAADQHPDGLHRCRAGVRRRRRQGPLCPRPLLGQRPVKGERRAQRQRPRAPALHRHGRQLVRHQRSHDKRQQCRRGGVFPGW